MLPKLNTGPRAGLIPVLAEGERIPQIIHQTYHSNELPPVLKENVARIRAMNPDWEYRFYDDEAVSAFIKTSYGTKVLAYFNRIDSSYGAARADLFRYLLLYKLGGVYLDIKGTFKKPLRDVLLVNDRYLLSTWRNGKGEKFEGVGQHEELRQFEHGEFQQWYIVASPGHPFLRAVIEGIFRNIDVYNPILHGVGGKGVFRVTGPIAYTLAIAPLLNLHQHRFADSDNDLGFEYSILRTNKAKVHKGLFKRHYSDLLDPIIKIEGRGPLALWFIRTVNRIRHRLEKRAR
jgi:hypothetical protein